ncbi:MAG TPA: glycosyltransferase family 4 protein [Chloroflexota bacterium]|nr:glycosyltransferase family 4 protein [Chloroflexota bacterium]
MRLVFVAPFATHPKATTSARVLPLARALAARGHAVTVLIPPYDNPAEGGRSYDAGAARVEALAVDAGLPEESPRQAIAQPQLAARLVRRALALRPDVVHVFKPKAVSGLAQGLLWYAGRAAAVLPVRAPAVVLDTDDWEGYGGWNEYEAYPWWQKLICDRQERWGLTHAAALTVASRTLEAQAWSHRVPPGRVVYLPNGLSAADFPAWRGADPGPARARLGLGADPVLLLYTRFFEFQPERALAVLAAVRARVPAARLLVVGAGKFGQERRLAALAAARGLDDAVVLAGWQEPSALPAVIATADVALFPADDNLANRAKCSVKLLQCLWLGLPVVADRVGQLAEYVQDGVSGALSDPEQPESMAAAAARLLQQPSLAARLGAAGRRRAEESFDWDRLAPLAERAYRTALKQTSR